MSHAHESAENNKAIVFGLVLNSVYTVVEFSFGIFTGSLALIADASHNLTDTLTLTISYVANRIAKRDPNVKKTYGYGRATILAALLNACIMVGVAVLIITEAISRLTHPQPVEGGIVALVAVVGIAVNGSIAFVLSKRRRDLNMRSAFIDMAFDAFSSLAAVIAGIIILLTNINGIDSIVGLLIALLLLYNTFKILSEAVSILLEGSPKDVDADLLKETIESMHKVNLVDDLHIWAIRSGYNALSCHIIIDADDIEDSRDIVEAVKLELKSNHNIQHSTIEVELDNKNHPDHNVV